MAVNQYAISKGAIFYLYLYLNKLYLIYLRSTKYMMILISPFKKGGGNYSIFILMILFISIHTYISICYLGCINVLQNESDPMLGINRNIYLCSIKKFEVVMILN